jgi:hypothetical protein
MPHRERHGHGVPHAHRGNPERRHQAVARPSGECHERTYSLAAVSEWDVIVYGRAPRRLLMMQRRARSGTGTLAVLVAGFVAVSCAAGESAPSGSQKWTLTNSSSSSGVGSSTSSSSGTETDDGGSDEGSSYSSSSSSSSGVTMDDDAPGGSSGGSDDGGGCSSVSCPNGCCDMTNTCQPGTDPAACGSGGEACSACSSDQTCTGGACSGSGSSSSGSSSSGSGGCVAASCGSCVLGTASCSSAGACQCCVGTLCAP